MKRKLKSDRGFTLAELLIVVAIIGVLVAIAIPIFTSQLERSREAVDLLIFRCFPYLFIHPNRTKQTVRLFRPLTRRHFCKFFIEFLHHPYLLNIETLAEMRF